MVYVYLLVEMGIPSKSLHFYFKLNMATMLKAYKSFDSGVVV